MSQNALTAISFDSPPAGAAASASRASAPSREQFPAGRGQPRLKRAELLQVSQQLSVMLETGVTIVEAFRCIAEQADKPNVRAVIESVAASIEQGEDFSTAITRHPRSFPRIFVALIRASEKGGMLSKMIDRATIYLRDEAEMIRRVKGAMTYPGIMFGFALTTTIFMLAFVLPRFVGLYQGKEHLLPVPTKILLALSHLLTSQWMYLVPASLIGAYLGVQWFGSPAGQKVWHRVQLSIPLVGPMYRKLHLSRGLRVIGTLLGAGVSLIDCLDTAKSLAGNGRYAAMWETVAYQIQQGNPFSETLRGCDLVPPAIAQMIHSGETGGRLSAVTERVAEHAEAELKETITEVTRYIEPAMIVLMGGLIGGLTLSLLLPVFTVSRVMTQ